MEMSATYQRFLKNTEEIRSRFPDPRSLDKSQRIELYDAIGSMAGNTPLNCLLYEGGRIWMKDESGSGLSETHYDRCFTELLREKELESRDPFDPRVHTLTEVSTGSAGVSFGAIGGKLLGYRTRIFIPPIDKVRANLIREVVDVVEECDSGFLDETVARFREALLRGGESVSLKAPDHSRSKSTPKAFRTIADEVIAKLEAQGIELDAFVCAVGNGTSIKGIAGRLSERWPNIQAHGFEDAAGGSAYYKMRGQTPPPISGKITMFGAGGAGDVAMPVVDELIREGRFKTSVLIGETEWKKEFEDWNTGRRRSETIGRSSAGALWRAKQLIRERVARDVLTIIYDKADRYGDVLVTDENACYAGNGQWE